MAAVARQARVQLEMGGKNPLVVLDDADFDRAVLCALDEAPSSPPAKRCTASSRIIVQDGIYKKFVEALTEKTLALTVGDALDPASNRWARPSATRNSNRICPMSILRVEVKAAISGSPVADPAPDAPASPAIT